MIDDRAAESIRLSTEFDADFNPATAAAQIVLERASGATLVDTNGHETIDLVDIIANIGHCHPRHVAALQHALTQMITGKSGTTNPARARLAQRLVMLTPMQPGKAYFVSNGSEAMDWAIRIARRATGKHEVLAFWGGVYGRTMGAMSLNGVTQRRRFGPMMPGTVHAPYPYCYRCPFGKQPETCGFFCIDFLDETLHHASAGDVGALVIEPYQGVGGMIFPPDGFLSRLQEWARANKMAFILDEVQSSFGRTGKMFALEWEDLTPEMICVGKGMGSGISIAAVLAETWMFDALAPGELSGGNGGNPLACTAALTVIDVLEDENLIENAVEIGAYFLERFRRWHEQYDVIGDVRGKGLALAMEFVRDRVSKEPYREIVQHISRYCYQQGVYVGGRSHILDVRPPLVISRDQAVRAADVMEAALEDALGA